MDRLRRTRECSIGNPRQEHCEPKQLHDNDSYDNG